MLHGLLRRAEALDQPVYTADEMRSWPAGFLDAFTERGVLVELGPAVIVTCDGCADAHLLNVDVCEYPTGTIGMGKCPECGRIQVSLERLRQWRFNLGGLAGIVMAAIGGTGQAEEAVAERIWSIGTIAGDTEPRDVFVARGLGRPDAAEVVRQAASLRRAPAPLVLTCAALPDPGIWAGFRPAVDVLTRVCRLEDDRFVVDLTMTMDRMTVPHPEAKPEDWLTVTAAAEKLMDVVDDVDIKKARARVSRAAGDEKFVTNGAKGEDRRIHIHAFSTWLMEQREKNLAAAN
jgi:hypothetical protein